MTDVLLSPLEQCYYLQNNSFGVLNSNTFYTCLNFLFLTSNFFRVFVELTENTMAHTVLWEQPFPKVSMRRLPNGQLTIPSGGNLSVLDPGGDISGCISHLCMSGSGRNHLGMLGTVQSGVPDAPQRCHGSTHCVLHPHFFCLTHYAARSFFQHRAQSPSCSSLAAPVERVTLTGFGPTLPSIFPGGFSTRGAGSRPLDSPVQSPAFGLLLECQILSNVQREQEP